MGFSITSFKSKSPFPSRAAKAVALLSDYDEFGAEALEDFERERKGERGILVLSHGREDPVFAKTEEYYTGDEIIENTRGVHQVYDLHSAGCMQPIRSSGLASTAVGYQTEQEQLTKWNAEAQKVKYDLLFDAEVVDAAEAKDQDQGQDQSFLGRGSHETTRALKDLIGISLHELIPGLEFLPGLETLNNIEVRNVHSEFHPLSFRARVERVLPETTSTLDVIDTWVEDSFYLDEEDYNPYVVQAFIGSDVRQQDSPTIPSYLSSSIRLETAFQPSAADDNTNEDNALGQQTAPHSFYDPATGQDIGYTAINHLLDPEVEEAFPQIHRAEDDFEDEYADVDIMEVSAGIVENAPEDEELTRKKKAPLVRHPRGLQPTMWSSHRRPHGWRIGSWRPTEVLNQVLEDTREVSPTDSLYSNSSLHESVELPGHHDPMMLVGRPRGNLSDDKVEESEDESIDIDQDSRSDSNHSINFTSPRDFSTPLRNRQSKLLDNEDPQHIQTNTKADPSSPLLDIDTLLFSSDIWHNEVDLNLWSPTSETQRIDLPRTVENYSELPSLRNSTDSIPSAPSECSQTSIDDFEVTLQALTSFTEHYVEQIGKGHVEYMTVVRDKILEDYDDEDAFGLQIKTIDDAAWFAHRLFKALSIDVARAHEELRPFHERVIMMAGGLNCKEDTVETRLVANRAWNTLYACMQEIETAHQEMLDRPGMIKLADEVSQTEQLLWRDWLRHIQAAFEAKDGYPLLVQDFLLSSLHWWQAKTSQAMRRWKGRGWLAV
ncbi:hypothetical protein N0V90_009243 [Kalmusia sp. IMI 367209]|nr:hypothetical protein N0V90_009243 [Kalmusia sp. IMI 367209]